MQKKSLLQHREQLFSSHSSPSSSYNKYKASHSPLDSSTSLDKTPPSRSIKSLSSSTYARSRNNHLSPNPARTFETTDTRNLSKNSGIVRSKDNVALAGHSNSYVNNSNKQYENIQVSPSTNQGGNNYSVVAMEAQRKVSEAVVAGGPKARARRNSFREAVESKGEKDNKKEDDKKFVTEAVNSARWLMRAIEQRNSTTLKVAVEILKQQKQLSTSTQLLKLMFSF